LIKNSSHNNNESEAAFTSAKKHCFSPTRLFLLRHGEVEGDGALHGHVDVTLTETGVRQMEEAAKRLANEPIAAVYSSDLTRTRRGASIIADRRELPVTEIPEFRELNMGRWDNRPLRDIWREERELVEAWWADLENFTLPQGESLSELKKRVAAALTPILKRHSGETICLVAHGGVNRVVLFEAMGLPLSHFHRVAQDYGCINLLEFHSDEKVVLRLLNG